MTRRYLQQLTQPVSLSIPYDIWASVIACLDFYTLESFALVSRDFKHEVDKHIWRSCTLYVPARLNEHWARMHLEEGCDILLRDGRAARVRDLRVDVQAFLGANGSEEMRRTLNSLVEVLRRATRLRSLEIKSIHHRAQIARALSQPAYYDEDGGSVGGGPAEEYPFCLERFATDLFCDEHLYPFWASQSASITNVELLAVDSGLLRVAPSTSPPRYVPFPLPSLNTVNAAYAHHLSIVRESPVTSVVLDGVWEGELGMVKDNLCSVKPATLELLLADEPLTTSSDLDNTPYQPYTKPSLRNRSPSRKRLLIERYGSTSPYPPSRFNPLFASQTNAPTPLHPAPTLGPALLSLRLTLFDPSPTSHLYTHLLAFLPHLRTLALTHADITSRADRAAALAVLAGEGGGMRELEEFEWSCGGSGGSGCMGMQAAVFGAVAGGRGRGATSLWEGNGAFPFAAAGNGAEDGWYEGGVGGERRAGRCLRVIVFRWGNGNYFERRFERESEDAGWGIVAQY